MAYRFQSKADGDVLMRQADGERVLRAMGLEPAPQGILEPPAMAWAMQALTDAIAREAAAVAPAVAPQEEPGPAADEPISLGQRAWPLLEMMKRALAADQPIVWGV